MLYGVAARSNYPPPCALLPLIPSSGFALFFSFNDPPGGADADKFPLKMECAIALPQNGGKSGHGGTFLGRYFKVWPNPGVPSWVLQSPRPNIKSPHAGDGGGAAPKLSAGNSVQALLRRRRGRPQKLISAGFVIP